MMDLITFKNLKQYIFAELRLIGSALIEAECRDIIDHVFGFSATDMIIHAEDAVPYDKFEHVRNILERRKTGEPLDHIFGFRYFFGRRFEISKEVLSPREDTEVLISAALERLPPDQPANILDLGTGSGALAITLAAERKHVRVTATDISHSAIEIARRNAKNHGVLGRIDFVQGDWFAAVSNDALFDMVVTNPPYISDKAYENLETEVSVYDPEIALRGGPDGLEAYRKIISAAAPHMRPGSGILLEIGFDQATSVSDLCRSAGLGEIFIHPDIAGHDRVVLAKKS